MSKRAPPTERDEQQEQQRHQKQQPEKIVSDLVQLLPQLVQDEMPSLDSRTTTTRSAKLRAVVGICFLLALAGMLYLGYFCPDHVCALTSRDPKEPARLSEVSILSGTRSYLLSVFLLSRETQILYEYLIFLVGLGSNSLELEKNNLVPMHPAFKLQSIQGSNPGYDDIFLNDTFQFDINANDVMVFLHIQKTG